MIVEDFDSISQRLKELEKEKEKRAETPIVLDSNPPEYREFDPWGYDYGCSA